MNDKNTFYKCDTTARIRTLISSFGDYCATIAQQPQTYAVYFQVVPNRLEIAQHMKRICVASLFYVKATLDCTLVRGGVYQSESSQMDLHHRSLFCRQLALLTCLWELRRELHTQQTRRQTAISLFSEAKM